MKFPLIFAFYVFASVHGLSSMSDSDVNVVGYNETIPFQADSGLFYCPALKNV